MDISKLSMIEIKEIISLKKLDNSFLQAMAKDSRIGVRKLYERIIANRKKYEREMFRLSNLFKYEKNCRLAGYELIAGVDEAGRGPLAGPVVAAAVILPEQAYLPGLNDSKKLTAASREALFVQIKDISLSYTVQFASVEEIYKLNIYHASILAMRRAVLALILPPDFVMIDGMEIPELNYPQMSLVKGDALSASIAAASILAKVTRDHLMSDYHEMYPQYGFDRNKGYPTAEHKKALLQYGPCEIHRFGYKPVRELCYNK